MPLLLTDSTLAGLVSMSEAIQAARAVLRERLGGTTAPQACSTRLPQLQLAGGHLGARGRSGLRADAGPSSLAAVWDEAGRLDGLLVGAGLKVLCSGAMGGVAFQALAPQLVSKVAVLGTGSLASTQLRALRAVRQPEYAEVFCRDRADRAQAAAELRDEFKLPVTAATSAETAVRGADVVIVCLDAAARVQVAAEWVTAGAHVSCTGTVARAHSLLELALLERAALVTTDFPEDLRADPESILHGTPTGEALVDLASLLTEAEPRDPEAITVFLERDLPETAVALGALALEKARSTGKGLQITC